MSKVIVTTENKWKAGQTNILPYVGKIEFDENACFETEESIAEKLIEYSTEFFIFNPNVEEDIKKKAEESEELAKSDEDDILPQIDDKVQEESSIEDLSSQLQKLSVKELKDNYLSLFPKEDTKDLKNKDQYIKFILDHLVDAE